MATPFDHIEPTPAYGKCWPSAFSLCSPSSVNHLHPGRSPGRAGTPTKCRNGLGKPHALRKVGHAGRNENTTRALPTSMQCASIMRSASWKTSGSSELFSSRRTDWPSVRGLAWGARFTLRTRAPVSMGNVTIEISQRSTA